MSLSEDANFPRCPDCGTNVLVERSHHNHYDWHCHGCDEHRDEREMRRSERAVKDGGRR